MLKTKITEAFGLSTPIINAGMAFVAGPELAGAVSRAGALGMLGMGMTSPEGLRHMIRHTRTLTYRAFGVDFIGDFAEDAHIDVICEERIDVVVFFWSPPSSSQVDKLKNARIPLWMQVGSVAEAIEAAKLGADALIIQGSEAGGHNRSEAPLARLFPAVRSALPDLPLIAAGGIMDGRTLLAALAMGAEAAWCGTRFLASEEAAAHEAYKRRVVEARPGDTELTLVFGPEWPGQPLRAIANRAVQHSRGRVAEALAEAAGDVIGSVEIGGKVTPVPKYSIILPNRGFDADLDWACLTAGECAGLIKDILPAADIVRNMTLEAHALLQDMNARAA